MYAHWIAQCERARRERVAFPAFDPSGYANSVRTELAAAVRVLDASPS